MSTRRQRLLLRVVVFVSGLTIMGIEMAASRLLAPYFGTSLYVWAVLIGLIMIYLTAGYYLGGCLVDRLPSADLLYRVTALAGFCVGLIPLLSGPILQWSSVGFDQLSAGVFLGSLTAVIALFAIPVVALGCVSPFAVRLSVTMVQQAGNAAGSMYALSTTGSLVGTFVTVFALIPTVGTRRTLLALSGGLVLVSLGGLWRRRPAYVVLLLPAVLQLMASPAEVRAEHEGKLIYATESAYYYIQVIQNGARRELILDEGHAVHSVYDPHRILTAEYWDDFLLAPLLRGPRADPVRRLAVLGLGGGTVARQYAALDPGVHIDAAEIDPAIVDVARRFFALHEPGLRVYTEDARYFLLMHSGRYDVVTVDAFRQPYIPFQLTTSDFFRLVRSRLTVPGVVAVNCGHTPGDFRLVNTLARTMRTVFPSVFIVDIPGTINSMVIGSTAQIEISEARTALARARGAVEPIAATALARGHLRSAPRTGPVFTDDLAPVEHLIDQMVLDYVRRGR